MEKLIEDINRLAKKAKEEGLSQEEKLEQDKLRKEYLEKFRGRMKDTLKTVKVVDDQGEDITPAKLKKLKQEEEN